MTHPWAEIWRYLNPLHPVITFLIGGGMVFFRRYWQKIRENRAAGWPSADAVVQSAKINVRNGFYVDVSY